MTFLDLHFPRRGQCLLCGVPGVDQRHRVVDGIRERLCTGDDEEMVARDYGLSVEAVLIAGTAVDAS